MRAFFRRHRLGVMVGKSPATRFSDAPAHGVPADGEPTFDLRFSATELWPNSADAAFVHVGVFQSRLVAVSGRLIYK